MLLALTAGPSEIDGSRRWCCDTHVAHLRCTTGGVGASVRWRGGMLFKNRTEAGRALATAVETMMARPFIVAALPRGGVAVALPVAERLAVRLAVIYARKLTGPRAPELAFGALE